MAKPRTQKLKVFRTPIGFHDAFVAAPSRAAALRAWGASTDLFSAGIAEPVTNQGAGAKAALARPGEVVRVGRSGEGVSASAGPAKKSPKRKSKPMPSRHALDKAEAALAALEQAQSTERAELAKEEAAFAKRRRALEARHSQARERAEAKREAAEKRYRQALEEWSG